MKQIKILLGLILLTSVSTFAQSPRIKLNQITKDSLSGSVLISSSTDSGMVYSRELYISYGADTVLILNGDTLAVTSGIISSVLSDGVTITGDGSVGNPLKVDTSVISTIRGLNDTLTTRGYLTSEVDGIITNEGSLTVGVGTATTSVISSNTDGSTDVTLEAGTNVTLSENTGTNTITIAASGGGAEIPVDTFVTIANAETITGAKTFTAALTQSGGDVNFDSNTLFVDESENKVGIGTSSPSEELELYSDQNGVNQIKIVNPNTGTSARGGIAFWNGTGGGDFFAFLLNGENYDGVAGWDDRFTVQSGSGVQNGLLFYSTSGGIQLSAKSTNTKDIYVEDGSGNVFMENLESTLVGDYDLRIKTTGEIGYNTSSVRFKENINDYNKGLEYVLALRPVTFNYIEDTLDRQMVGFIAEQLDEIGLQEGVVYKEDGSVEGINSRIYNPILVNAIQEQQAIIETIQSELTDKSSIIETQASEIDQLKSLIESLTTRIENLENN